eukprot:snap_masked-scaffold_4-processed-gene-11.32-mRNA-1 protein AED:1.00 eAED:1.00 QI:0/0/0/0/1/1/2/0/402
MNIYLFKLCFLTTTVLGKRVFNYKDFNTTEVIAIYGDTYFTSCTEDAIEDGHPAKVYSDSFDKREESELYVTHAETEELQRISLTTSLAQSLDIKTEIESIESMDNPLRTKLSQTSYKKGEWLDKSSKPYKPEQADTWTTEKCSVRARLTKSKRNQLGSITYTLPIDLLQGFRASFEFQITNPSVTCSSYRNPRSEQFQSKHYKTSYNEKNTKCRLDGADGFVFWVSNSPTPNISGHFNFNQNGDPFKGNNTVFWKFDHHYNPELGDVYMENIELFLNNVSELTALTEPREGHLSDGKIHKVWIEYTLTMKKIVESYDLAKTVSSTSEELAKALAVGTQTEPSGSFAVYLDRDKVTNDRMPISTAIIAMDNIFQTNELYVGISAITGAKWAQHDILSFSLST